MKRESLEMQEATPQLTLPLAIPLMRPLLPIPAVMVLADCDEDAVLTFVERGFLQFAFDLRSRQAERRELRVWRESLIWFLEHRASLDLTRPVKQREHAHSIYEVIGHCFPHSRERLRSPEVQRMFSCSQTHVAQLVTEGLLAAENKAGYGPNGFIYITRASIAQFLISRAEGAKPQPDKSR